MCAIELDKKVKDLRAMRNLHQIMEEQIEAAQAEIKAYLESNGLDELRGSDWHVSFKPVESKRFDRAAMIQTFGRDCYDSFCKTTVTRRFTLA